MLERIAAERGLPGVIRCDAGPELTSRHFLAWCLAPPLVAHLAKFRSLLPSLAGLFELADRAAGTAPLSGEIAISLVHTQQAGHFATTYNRTPTAFTPA